MAWPAPSSPQLDFVDLSAEPDCDSPPEAATAGLLAGGSDAQFFNGFWCDSPQRLDEGTLMPQQEQQQQQGLTSVPAAGWSSEGLHDGAATTAPAAFKLARVFGSSRNSAAAAAPAAWVHIAYPSYASDSAAFAAASASVQPPDVSYYAYAPQQPQEGDDALQLELQQPQQAAEEMQLTAAQRAKRAAWQDKLDKLSHADWQLLSVLNLPKATIKKGQAQLLAVLGVADEPDTSKYFYMQRGPQATLRGIVRRVIALFPEAYALYLRICRERGISEEGSQLDLSACEEFFAGLLAPLGSTAAAAAAYMPKMEERRPLREVEFTAGLASKAAGKAPGEEITAAQLNECFIPGGKNYEVDFGKLLELGIVANQVTLPLASPLERRAQLHSNSASNVSGSSAWPAAASDALPAAAARLTNSRQAHKRRAGAPSSSNNPLKKRREAAAALAHSALLLGRPAAAAAGMDDSVATVTAAASAYQ
uniref:Uncharacterized protein n=1 Tax=Tetradesmus obliquus TaxID=3088 RepID=A0A383VGH0_TETOB|eukprot:jgi/Sobl393_1/16212/SZX64020.1